MPDSLEKQRNNEFLLVLFTIQFSMEINVDYAWNSLKVIVTFSLLKEMKFLKGNWSLDRESNVFHACGHYLILLVLWKLGEKEYVSGLIFWLLPTSFKAPQYILLFLDLSSFAFVVPFLYFSELANFRMPFFLFLMSPICKYFSNSPIFFSFYLRFALCTLIFSYSFI